MAKKRKPQDQTVHKTKKSLDVLRARLARVERVLRVVHPAAWRAEK